jgi:hypothetical protein
MGRAFSPCTTKQETFPGALPQAVWHGPSALFRIAARLMAKQLRKMDGECKARPVATTKSSWERGRLARSQFPGLRIFDNSCGRGRPRSQDARAQRTCLDGWIDSCACRRCPVRLCFFLFAQTGVRTGSQNLTAIQASGFLVIPAASARRKYFAPPRVPTRFPFLRIGQRKPAISG